MVVRRVLDSIFDGSSITTPEGNEISSSVPMPPGFDSFLSSGAAASLQDSIQRGFIGALRTVSQTLGTPPPSFPTGPSSAASEPPPGTPPPSPPSGAPSAGDSAGFDPQDPNNQGPQSASPDPEEPEDTTPIGERFRRGRATGKQATASSAFSGAAGIVARSMSQATFQNYSLSEDGNTVLVSDVDGDGNKVTSEHLTRGSRGFMAASMAARYGKPLTTGLGRMAAGEVASTAGVIGGIARLAGPVGLAVGGGLAATEALEGQFSAGADFRQIYGQDAGRFAIEQRLDRSLAGLSGIGTIGRERATQIYNATAEMGLTGTRQDEARNFASDMFMDLGLDTSDSMRALEMSVQGANLSLDDLQRLMLDVSESAVEAGRNSKEAIQEFLQATQSLEGRVSANTGGNAEVVGGLENVRSLLPPDLARGNLGNIVGLINDKTISIVAARQGLDTSTLINQSRSGDPVVNLSIIAGAADSIVQQLTGMSISEFKDLLPAGFEEADFIQQTEILQALNLDSRVIERLFVQQYDWRGSGPDAVRMFIEMLTGAYTEGIQESVRDIRRRDRQEETNRRREASKPPVYVDRSAVTRPMGEAAGFAVLRETLGYDDDLVDETGVDDSLWAYLNLIDENDNAGNKIIENLLDPKVIQKMVGAARDADDASELQFEVKDGEGSKKVSLAELISEERFRNQLNAGSAELVGGNGRRIKVSEYREDRTVEGASVFGGPPGQMQVQFKGYAEQILRSVIEPENMNDTGTPAPSRQDPRTYRGND